MLSAVASVLLTWFLLAAVAALALGAFIHSGNTAEDQGNATDYPSSEQNAN